MRGEGSFEASEASGKAVTWALRQAGAWSVIAAVVYILVAQWGSLAPVRPTAAPAPADAEAGTAASSAPITNTLRYPADATGHVRLEADVDGAMVHFVVDTGATLVTLTPADAEAAGINPAGLVFSVTMNTANGQTRAAPVLLRAVRLGQLTIEDVQAVVVPNVPVSLLGMSLLSRIDRWEMRGGVLTISY
ncbi:MAG TPA: TIGR02281 family clan AA aspartic protease [Stellaceae bacterium]|jgi:aspartyl protease family protein